MFENRSQQSKTEVNARTERSQNSSHEQTCFLLKKKPVEYHYSSSSRKNQEHRNIATLSLQLRSYKNEINNMKNRPLSS